MFRASPSTLTYQLFGTRPGTAPPSLLHQWRLPLFAFVIFYNFCVPCSSLRRVSASSPRVTHAWADASSSKPGIAIGCTSLYFANSPMVTCALALSAAMNCFNALSGPIFFLLTVSYDLQLVNNPQISERWGYAHEVHLDKCNRARDFVQYPL